MVNSASDIIGTLCLNSDNDAQNFIKANILEVIVTKLLQHDYSTQEMSIKPKLLWVIQNLQQK